MAQKEQERTPMDSQSVSEDWADMLQQAVEPVTTPEKPAPQPAPQSAETPLADLLGPVPSPADQPVTVVPKPAETTPLGDLLGTTATTEEPLEGQSEVEVDSQRPLEITAEDIELDGEVELDAASAIPLYDFQEASVEHMTTVIPPEARNYLCLLADEQGMGKTRQLIAAAVELGQFPAVAFAPANLVEKWEEDFAELAPQLSVKVSPGDLSQMGWWEGADVVLVSYSNATDLYDVLLPPEGYFKCYLADEAHYLKNPKARRTRVAYSIRMVSMDAACFLATGTPIYSRPSDLLTQLEILGQLRCFGGAGTFCKAFTRIKYGVERAKNTELLHEMLKLYCNLIRRTKDGRLTEKTRHLIPLTLPAEDMHEYTALEQQARALRKNKKMYLGAVQRMRTCLSRAKLNTITKWIETWMAEHPGESLLAFGVFTDTIDVLKERFPDAAVYYGKTSKKNKKQIRKDFQAGKYRLFLGNITAAGVGLDLYHASHVVFFDLPWTASELFQAEDRVHRFGQTEPVHVHLPFFEKTRDERNISIIVSRAQDARMVVDGKQDWTPDSFINASRASVEFGDETAA